MKSNHPMRIVFIAVALLLALCTPAMMKKGFSQSQSATSFAPPVDKEQLWHIQVYRVKPSNMTEFISFIKHEMNPARIKGGANRLDYWETVYGNATELINIAPMPGGYAEIGQPNTVSKALGEGASGLFARQARFIEERLNYIVRYDPTLSFTSAKFQGKPDWAIFNVAELAPGQAKAYEDWLKNDFIPAERQGSSLARWYTKMRFGGDMNNTYLMLRPLSSPAEIEQPAPNADARARAANVNDKLPAGAIARQDRRRLRYRPDISIFDGKIAESK